MIDKNAGQVFEIERIERGVEDGETVATRASVRLELAPGDRIPLTRPHRVLGLPRSSFGTVMPVSGTGFDLLMDGQHDAVTIDAGAFPYFDYGYTATIHKAQGMTEDQVLVLLHRFMDRYAMNVALTHHRERVTVFGRKAHCDSIKSFYRLGLQRGTEYTAPQTSEKPGPWCRCHKMLPF